MTNATIARPEWTTIIDPVLQKELEQHVLVTTWDKLLGIVDTVYNWGRRVGVLAAGLRAGLLRYIEMICSGVEPVRTSRGSASRGLPRLAAPMSRPG